MCGRPLAFRQTCEYLGYARFSGHSPDPDEAGRKRGALPHIRRQSRKAFQRLFSKAWRNNLCMLRKCLKYLIVIGALVATLAPVYWMITISFKREVDQFAVPPQWFRFTPTLEHYADAFLDRSFGQYLFNSLFVAVASTRCALVLGTLAAYALARFRLP